MVNLFWNNDSVCNTLQEIIQVGFNNVVTFYITADESSAKCDIKSVVPVLNAPELALSKKSQGLYLLQKLSREHVYLKPQSI